MVSERAAPAGLSAHPTITLHSSGDITLLIGTVECQQPVIAASATLRKASPVWNAMCTGSWSESTNSEIHFPDDDVDAMLIVLNIAHLNFKDIPRARGLSLETLVQLCVVCDKYDTLPIVRPFLDLYKWARDDYTDWESEIEDHFYYNEWLFVSWTLGYKESFLAVAKDLILTMSIDTQKPNDRAMSPIYVKTQYGDTFGDIMPPGVFVHILKIREDTLTAVLNRLYSGIDKFINETVCYDPLDQDKCQSQLLGYLIKGMIKMDLYPTKKTGADVTVSIKAFMRQLGSIKFAALNQRHEGCDPETVPTIAIQRAIASMADTTLDEFMRHMEAQAKK